MKIGNCNDAPRVIGQEACTDAAHIVEKIAGDCRGRSCLRIPWRGARRVYPPVRLPRTKPAWRVSGSITEANRIQSFNGASNGVSRTNNEDVGVFLVFIAEVEPFTWHARLDETEIHDMFY